MDDKQQILPTPPVGWPVVWYRSDMEQNEPIAATVTAVEAPGRVSLYYVALNGFLAHKRGVNWVGDDRRLSPGRPFRVNGCWDFLPDIKPRNATKFHKDEIARREKLEKQRQDEFRRQREEAEKAHEARKQQIEAK